MIETRIRETELPEQGLIVITAKLTDPNLTQPFETFTICDSSGYASPIAYFATEAAALAAHDHVLKVLRAPIVKDMERTAE